MTFLKAFRANLKDSRVYTATSANVLLFEQRRCAMNRVAHLRQLPHIPADGVNPIRGRAAVRRLLSKPLITSRDLILPVLLRHSAEPSQSATPLIKPVVPRAIPQLAEELAELGIKGIKLFAGGRRKTEHGKEILRRDNLMHTAIKLFRRHYPEVCILTETCLCSYTRSGACVLSSPTKGVDYEATVGVIAAAAVMQADAGADIVGPAGMYEGAVTAVRHSLDAHGHRGVGVMPHLIFDSELYAIYRKTMGARPKQGNRLGFQIEVPHQNQALQTARRFIEEGADSLLLEPALFTMDLLATVRPLFAGPLVPFSVSGEYRMLTNATDDPAESARIMLEYLGTLKRAGADSVITYAARTLAPLCSD